MKKLKISLPKMPKTSSKLVKIAIIGGSGVYDPSFFKKEKEIRIKTPFGYPSTPIEIGEFLPAQISKGKIMAGEGQKIAFLARHGKQHQFPPHKVPQRANIWALKKLGAERIIGVCTVGSLKDNFKPGEIIICDQFIDFTKKRDYTFYDKEAIHVSEADPFCPELRKLFFKEGKKILPAGRHGNIPIHKNGTYICIEGPRFSTRAESKFFRNYADVIGMTLVPEAVLAREMEMCYLSLAMITDFDVWQEKPVNAKEVVRTMKENLEKIKKLFSVALPKISKERGCLCKTALKEARL